ncbi:MAG: class I SAM-dependent methyltransferase [Hyphomicrobium sp.]|jgi:hypothetical protein
MNPKAAAWDRVGGAFWRLGRPSAKPSQAAIDLYLAGMRTNDRVCVVGASTKSVVAAALDRGLEVSVIDFSSVMCEDLETEIPSARLRCYHRDILAEPEPSLRGRFDLLIADRLVNRMERDEIPRLFINMAAMLRPGRELRVGVKIGFYPSDSLLIEEGRRAGTLSRFFDERNSTIDYSKATDELSRIALTHGDIPRETLLVWYAGRGRESRFELADLSRAVAVAQTSSSGLSSHSVRDLPDADSSVLLTLRLAAA